MKKSYGTVVWHLGYRVHLAWIRVMTAEGVRTVPMTRSGQAAGGTHSACAYTLMLSVSHGAAARGAPNVRQCCPNSLCRHCAAGGLGGRGRGGSHHAPWRCCSSGCMGHRPWPAFPIGRAQRPPVGGSVTSTDTCITIHQPIFIKCFYKLPLIRRRRKCSLARWVTVRGSGRSTRAVMPCRGPCRCGRGSMVPYLTRHRPRRATSPRGTACAAGNMYREGQGGEYA